MAGERFELANRAAAVEAIRRMNEEDLRFLNRLIVERLKLIAQARSTTMLARFSVGDRVSFQSHVRRAEGRRHHPAQQENCQHRHRRRTTMECPSRIPDSLGPGDIEPQGENHG